MSTLWFHQQRVADLVASGKNIILQAPTGSGKTRAALFPFLDAFNDLADTYGSLPRRCIYSVPMRILATQFNDEYQRIVKGYANRLGLEHISVTIQTGESQKDPQFTGNLIFATIDQTLSSFLISPYSLSRNKANLNAGAVLSSYLVFDEFHLFDPNSTLPTTLHMLKMLKGITPFVLMTATFSQTMLKELACELDAVVVGQSDAERDEFAKLPSQNKRRFYHTVDDVLSAEAVLSEHHALKTDKKRSLVICNTVERARELYTKICEQKRDGTQVILLHSRLLPEHRKTQEDSIRTEFGQDSKGGDFIVVSTQAIEVGVDMTSSVLHTELAPANAIIQRAGRCARYENEVGHVYIYRQAIDKDGEVIILSEKPAPYMQQEDVISKTWDAFWQRDGQLLTFAAEQAVLSAAHEAQDRQIIQWLREDSFNHKRGMYGAMRGEEDARNYIRQIISQQVTIHDNPAEVAKNPFVYPSFGLHPGTVQKYLDDWLDRREFDSDIVAIRENKSREKFEDEAQANDERYYLDSLNDKKAGFMAQLLVIHPRLARYDDKLGFIADEGGTWIAQPNTKSNEEEPHKHFTYRLETYERHIELVYQEFTKFWKEAEWAARKLEQHFGWAKDSIYKAAQLAVLLHDVGKLSTGWQGWVRKYQAALIEHELEADETVPRQAYAHTDSRSDNDRYREIANSMRPSRPWHAVEGAFSVLDILYVALDEHEILTKAAFSAIARHHTAHSQEHKPYQLTKDALTHIAAVFEEKLPTPDLSAILGMDERIEPHLSQAADHIIYPGNESQDLAGYLAYLLIVRALRRADSEGTRLGSLPID